MKQNLFNKLWLRVGMIVAIMTTALAGTVKAQTPVVTADFTTASVGNSNYTNTWTYGNWSLTNCANNNKQWAYIRCGGKGGSQTNSTQTSETTIKGTVAITQSINEVKLLHNGKSNSNFTVNSIVLEVASDAAFSNIINTITETPSISTSTAGNVSFTTEAPYAANSYYRVTINWTVKGKTNYGLDVTKIEFYEAGSSLTANDLNLNAATKEFDLADGDGQTFQLTNSGSADGALSYESSNTAVATVSNTGLITAVGEGTATITVTQAQTSTYYGGEAECTVTVTDSRYTISDLTFTTAYGSGPGTADDDAEWTVTSDASESAYDGTKGIHYGTSSAAVEYIILSTSDINGTIKKVVVNASTAKDVTATVDVTVDGSAFGGAAQSLTSSAANYTFTGSAEGEIIVTVTKPNSANGALYVKSVKVYYEPSTDPVIVATDPAELAYDATGGEITYSITNPTSATLSAASNSAWITNVAVDATNSKVTFNTSTNPNTTQRTGSITLSYTGADDKVVTITQAAAPVIYTTIPAIFDAATSAGSTATNVNVTFGNWVVSGVHNNNVFLTDNQGNGFIIYKSDHGFEVNDKLSGTVSETPLKLYNGSAEFTNLTASTSGLTVTNDGEITVITNKTIAELGGVNTGAVITLSNLTYDGTNLSDGTNTIKPYNSLYSEMSFTSGKTYNITGVYQQFNTNSGNTKEILPRSAADIEEVVSAEPSITLASYSVEATATTDLSGTIEVTYDNITTVASDIAFYESDGTTAATYNWIRVTINSSDNVEYSIDANNGAARTAYFKVWAYDDNMNEVYSGLVTVTQAAYVAPVVTITTDGNYFVKVTSTADITDGAYLIVYEDGGVAFNGNLETLDATSNTIDVTIKNGVIVANSTNKAAAFFIRTSNNTMMTQNGKYVGKTANANGMDVKDDEITNTFSIDNGNAVITASGGCAMKYNSATDQLRFRYYKSGQKDIQLYKLVDEAAGLNSEGYATFASTSALDFTDAELNGYSAWAITAISGENITFTQVTGAVPAGTGVLLKGTASTPVVLTTTTGATTAVNGNKLVGITSATDVTAGQYYGLSGKTFVKVNAGTVPAGKALLPASALSNNVKAFTFVFEEDDATGISLMEDGRSQMEDGVIYNLAGQRISKMQKGINIVNGKKVLK